jgi:hypothetical protein
MTLACPYWIVTVSDDEVTFFNHEDEAEVYVLNLIEAGTKGSEITLYPPTPFGGARRTGNDVVRDCTETLIGGDS